MWMKKEKKNNNMKKDIILEKKIPFACSLFVCPSRITPSTSSKAVTAS
jgi:hypothetical protein